jgi:hypothetical protein
LFLSFLCSCLCSCSCLYLMTSSSDSWLTSHRFFTRCFVPIFSFFISHLTCFHRSCSCSCCCLCLCSCFYLMTSSSDF